MILIPSNYGRTQVDSTQGLTKSRLVLYFILTGYIKFLLQTMHTQSRFHALSHDYDCWVVQERLTHCDINILIC